MTCWQRLRSASPWHAAPLRTPPRGVPLTRPGITPQKGPIVRKTIQELREARGESQMQLAQAIGVTRENVAEWEAGTAEPRISHMRTLTKHFGVRDDQINLRPGEASSLIDRLVGWS